MKKSFALLALILITTWWLTSLAKAGCSPNHDNAVSVFILKNYTNEHIIKAIKQLFTDNKIWSLSA